MFLINSSFSMKNCLNLTFKKIILNNFLKVQNSYAICDNQNKSHFINNNASSYSFKKKKEKLNSIKSKIIIYLYIGFNFMNIFIFVIDALILSFKSLILKTSSMENFIFFPN